MESEKTKTTIRIVIYTLIVVVGIPLLYLLAKSSVGKWW